MANTPTPSSPNGQPGPDVAAQNQAQGAQVATQAFQGLGQVQSPQLLNQQPPAPQPKPAYDTNHFEESNYTSASGNKYPVLRQKGTEGNDMVYVNAATAPKLAQVLSQTATEQARQGGSLKPGDPGMTGEGWYNTQGKLNDLNSWTKVDKYDPTKSKAYQNVQAKVDAQKAQNPGVGDMNMAQRAWAGAQNTINTNLGGLASTPIQGVASIYKHIPGLSHAVPPDQAIAPEKIVPPAITNANENTSYANLRDALQRFHAEHPDGSMDDFYNWSVARPDIGAQGGAPVAKGAKAEFQQPGTVEDSAKSNAGSNNALLRQIATGQPGGQMRLDGQTVPYLLSHLDKAVQIGRSTENPSGFGPNYALRQAFAESSINQADQDVKDFAGIPQVSDKAEAEQRLGQFYRNLHQLEVDGKIPAGTANHYFAKYGQYALSSDPKRSMELGESSKANADNALKLSQDTPADPEAMGALPEAVSQTKSGRFGSGVGAIAPTLLMPEVGFETGTATGAGMSGRALLGLATKRGLSSAIDMGSKMTLANLPSTLSHADPDNASNAVIRDFGTNSAFGFSMGVVNPYSGKLAGYLIPGLSKPAMAGRALVQAGASLPAALGTDATIKLASGMSLDEIKKESPETAAQFAVMEAFGAYGRYKAGAQGVNIARKASATAAPSGEGSLYSTFMEGGKTPTEAMDTLHRATATFKADQAQHEADAARYEKSIEAAKARIEELDNGGPLAANAANPGEKKQLQAQIKRDQKAMKASREMASQMKDAIKVGEEGIKGAQFLTDNGYTWDASGLDHGKAVQDRLAANAKAAESNPKAKAMVKAVGGTDVEMPSEMPTTPEAPKALAKPKALPRPPKAAAPLDVEGSIRALAGHTEPVEPPKPQVNVTLPKPMPIPSKASLLSPKVEEIKNEAEDADAGALASRIGMGGLEPDRPVDTTPKPVLTDEERRAEGNKVEPTGLHAPELFKKRAETIKRLYPNTPVAEDGSKLPDEGKKTYVEFPQSSTSRINKAGMTFQSAQSKAQEAARPEPRIQQDFTPDQKAKGAVTIAMNNLMDRLAMKARSRGDRDLADTLTKEGGPGEPKRFLAERDVNQESLAVGRPTRSTPEVVGILDKALAGESSWKRGVFKQLIRLSDPEAIPSSASNGAMGDQVKADVFNYRQLLAKTIHEASMAQDGDPHVAEAMRALEEHAEALGIRPDTNTYASHFEPNAQNPLSKTSATFSSKMAQKGLEQEGVHGLRAEAMSKGLTLNPEQRREPEFQNRVVASEANPNGLTGPERSELLRADLRDGQSPEAAHMDMRDPKKNGVYHGKTFDWVHGPEGLPMPVPGEKHLGRAFHAEVESGNEEPGAPVGTRGMDINKYAVGPYAYDLSSKVGQLRGPEAPKFQMALKPEAEPYDERSAQEKVLNTKSLSGEEMEDAYAAILHARDRGASGVRATYEAMLGQVRDRLEQMKAENVDGSNDEAIEHGEAYYDELMKRRDAGLSRMHPEDVEAITQGVRLNKSKIATEARNVMRHDVGGIERMMGVLNGMGVPTLTDRQVQEMKDAGLMTDEDLSAHPEFVHQLIGGDIYGAHDLPSEEEQALYRPKTGISEAERGSLKPFEPGEAGALAQERSGTDRENEAARIAGHTKYLAGGNAHEDEGSLTARGALHSTLKEMVARGLINPFDSEHFVNDAKQIRDHREAQAKVSFVHKLLDEMEGASQFPAVQRMGQKLKGLISENRVERLGPKHALDRGAMAKTIIQTPGEEDRTFYHTAALSMAPSEVRSVAGKQEVRAYRDALRQMTESPLEKAIRKEGGEAAGRAANELMGAVRTAYRSQSPEGNAALRNLFDTGAGRRLMDAHEGKLSDQTKAQLDHIAELADAGHAKGILSDARFNRPEPVDEPGAKETQDEMVKHRNVLESWTDKQDQDRSPQARMEREFQALVNETRTPTVEGRGRSMPKESQDDSFQAGQDDAARRQKRAARTAPRQYSYGQENLTTAGGQVLDPAMQSAFLNPDHPGHAEVVRAVRSGRGPGEAELGTSLETPLGEESEDGRRQTLGDIIADPNTFNPESLESRVSRAVAENQPTDEEWERSKALAEKDMREAYGPLYVHRLVNSGAAAKATIEHMGRVLNERGAQLNPALHQGLFRDAVLADWHARGQEHLVHDYEDNLSHALRMTDRAIGLGSQRERENMPEDARAMHQLTQEMLSNLPPHMINNLHLRFASPEELKALTGVDASGAYDPRTADTFWGNDLMADTIHLRKALMSVAQNAGATSDEARAMAWRNLHHELGHWVETYQLGSDGYAKEMLTAFGADAHKQLNSLGYGPLIDPLMEDGRGGRLSTPMGALAGAVNGKLGMILDNHENAMRAVQSLDKTRFDVKTEPNKSGKLITTVTDKKLNHPVYTLSRNADGSAQAHLDFNHPTLHPFTNASEWHAELKSRALMSVLDGKLDPDVAHMTLSQHLVNMAVNQVGLVDGMLAGTKGDVDWAPHHEALKTAIMNMADSISLGKKYATTLEARDPRSTLGRTIKPKAPGQPERQVEKYMTLQGAAAGADKLSPNAMAMAAGQDNSRDSVGEQSLDDAAPAMARVAANAWRSLAKGTTSFAKRNLGSVAGIAKDHAKDGGLKKSVTNTFIGADNTKDNMDTARRAFADRVNLMAAVIHGEDSKLKAHQMLEDVLNRGTTAPMVKHIREQMRDDANLHAVEGSNAVYVKHKDEFGEDAHSLVLRPTDGSPVQAEHIMPGLVHLANMYYNGEDLAGETIKKTNPDLKAALDDAIHGASQVTAALKSRAHADIDTNLMNHHINRNGTASLLLVGKKFGALEGARDPVTELGDREDVGASSKINPASLENMQFRYRNPMEAAMAGERRLAIASAWSHMANDLMHKGRMVFTGAEENPDPANWRELDNVPNYLKGEGERSYGVFHAGNFVGEPNADQSKPNQQYGANGGKVFVRNEDWAAINSVFGKEMTDNDVINALTKIKSIANPIRYAGAFHIGTGTGLATALQTGRLMGHAVGKLGDIISPSESGREARIRRLEANNFWFWTMRDKGNRINDLHNRTALMSDDELMQDASVQMTPQERGTLMGLRATGWTPKGSDMFTEMSKAMAKRATSQAGFDDVRGFEDFLNKPTGGVASAVGGTGRRFLDWMQDGIFNKYLVNLKAYAAHGMINDVAGKHGYDLGTREGLNRWARDLKTNENGIRDAAWESISRADDIFGMANVRRLLADPRMSQIYNAMSAAFMWRLGNNRSMYKTVSGMLQRGSDAVTGNKTARSPMTHSLGFVAGQAALWGIFAHIMMGVGVFRHTRDGQDDSTGDKLKHFVLDSLYPPVGNRDNQQGAPHRVTAMYLGDYEGMLHPQTYFLDQMKNGANPALGYAADTIMDLADQKQMGDPKAFPMFSAGAKQKMLEYETPREDDNMAESAGRFATRAAVQAGTAVMPFSLNTSYRPKDIGGTVNTLMDMGVKQHTIKEEGPEGPMTRQQKEESDAEAHNKMAKLPGSGADSEGRRFKARGGK